MTCRSLPLLVGLVRIIVWEPWMWAPTIVPIRSVDVELFHCIVKSWPACDTGGENSTVHSKSPWQSSDSEISPASLILLFVHGNLWPLTPSLLRFSTRLEWAGAGPLSSRHLPLSHHLPSVLNEEEACAPRRSLRVCAQASQHHLPQLQLHGPAAAVRVAAPRHFVCRRSGRHSEPAARAQVLNDGHLDVSNTHLAVHFQLPCFCGELGLPAPRPDHDLPRLLMDGRSQPFPLNKLTEHRLGCHWAEELSVLLTAAYASRARRCEASRCLI